MAGVGTPRRILSDRYALDREIGRGAMGVVFRAHDLRHGRDVAIKLLAESVDAVGAERFIAEIRTAAQLNHPHILAVHDSGEADGRLFYVMPLVDGESLRERLERQHSLPVAEAVRIAREIAEALAYAHARGVVHRDVKPENILLDSSGHAILADFGLARALSAVDSTRRTTAGLAIGSPDYMSPEQAAGAGHAADGRSDIYALGCVLFEMLAGRAPFKSDTVDATLRRHLAAPPPSIRARRADVPPHLDRAILHALAKSPEQRTSTGQAFAQEISTPVSSQPRPVWRNLLRLNPAVFAAASVSVVAALLFLLTTRVDEFGAASLSADPDSLRIAVIQIDRNAAALPFDVREAIDNALLRWNEIRTADPIAIEEDVKKRGSTLTSSDALAIARSQFAGRYVVASTESYPGYFTIDASLYDSSTGALLRRATARLAAVSAVRDSIILLLVDTVLFGPLSTDEPAPSSSGTRSIAAYHSYRIGRRYMDAWDLARADSLLRISIELDPDFTRAHLYLAQVRNWADADARGWQVHAERALRGATALRSREQLMARGLAALVNRDFDSACSAYDSLRALEPADFTAWFGRGECFARDDIVVPAPGSPTGWVFRRSYHQAVESYRRAFELSPLSYRGFTRDAFRRVREALFTQPNRIRFGFGNTAQRIRYVSWPTWAGDTLALYPAPLVGPTPPWRPPLLSRRAAHAEHRKLFNRLATLWVGQAPRDPEALLALALSRGMVGDASALTILDRARNVARTQGVRLQLAAAAVWLNVKVGTPDRVDLLVHAHLLADSLLRNASPDNSEDAYILAGLAALIGRTNLAAAHASSARPTGRNDPDMSEALAAVLNPLVVLAAGWGASDSLAALEARAELVIRRTTADHDYAMMRSLHLEQAAIMAFPHYRFRLLSDTAHLQSPLAKAQGALGRNDDSTAMLLLSRIESEFDPVEITIDMLLPFAQLLSTLNHAERAAELIDAFFASLITSEPGILESISRAGSIGRALAFRAELATAAGDSSSGRRWGSARNALHGSSAALQVGRRR